MHADACICMRPLPRAMARRCAAAGIGAIGAQALNFPSYVKSISLDGIS